MIALLISTKDRPYQAPWVQSMIKRQTYKNIKIIVVDGSEQDNFDAWSYADIYDHSPYAPLGASRNKAIEHALALKADYMAFMDDDDYYAPAHLELHLKALANSTAEISGSTLNGIYYLKSDKYLISGPYNPYHTVEPACVFKASYALKHRFYNHTRGLMSEFTDDFTQPMTQVCGTIVVIAHESNTYDKRPIYENPAAWACSHASKDDLPVFKELAEYLNSNNHPMSA